MTPETEVVIGTHPPVHTKDKQTRNKGRKGVESKAVTWYKNKTTSLPSSMKHTKQTQIALRKKAIGGG